MRIRPADGSRFIGSVETNTLVSNNRSHVGVQVRDRVFDNLHPEGVPAGEWPGRFLARTGAKLIIEVKPAADFFGARFLQRRFRDWLYE